MPGPEYVRQDPPTETDARKAMAVIPLLQDVTMNVIGRPDTACAALLMAAVKLAKEVLPPEEFNKTIRDTFEIVMTAVKEDASVTIEGEAVSQSGPTEGVSN